MLRGMIGVLTGMKLKIKLEEEGSPCVGVFGSEPAHEVVTLLGSLITVDVTPSGELGKLLTSI